MNITTFLLSTVFLSKTLASKALHRVVRITLFLIIFSSFSSYAIAGIQVKQDIPRMVQRSDLIIRGKVISTESQWKEDSRGRHIYTSVTVKILDKIKGNIKDGAFAFEVVGGTVDDIRQVVSDTPAFEIDEDAIVFLAGYPLTIRQGTNGKILIYDGRVYWDDLEITVDSFIRALKILEQDPNAPISLGEKYQAPTAEATAVPVITSISSDEAPAGTNAQVTITGTNFGSTQGSSKVEFFYKSRQQKIPASIVSWSNTQIICTVPVGTTSAGSSLVIVTTSDGTSSGYVIEAAECFIHNGIKWFGTSPTVCYYINQNTSDCIGEGAAVQRGANTWNDVGADFTFQYCGSCSSTGSSADGINCNTWGTTSGSLATTYYWYYPSTGEIIECDIVFNDDYTWSTDPDTPSGEYDVESVALHEFGHWLNLADLYDIADSDKVMYGYISSGEEKRTLHSCDCDGICYIYGGCPSCSITVTSPDGDCWEVGEVYDINWVSEITSGNVKIDLYKGGSLDRVIALSTPDSGTGSYAWSVPVDGSLTGDCDYRIKVTDVSNSSCNGYSAYFCIATGAPVLHAEPNITPGLRNTIWWDPVPDANWYYAECANDANFAHTVIGSGWISDTNCTFTGLDMEHKYWYRVKAAPRIESWSQTSQAEFQTDTLTDTRATNDGDVVLTGGPVPPVVDTVGGTGTNFSTIDGYFNGFFVTKSTVLTQIEIYLDILTSTSIEFVVYEGGALFDDPYNRIHSSTLASSGTGTKFYGSGPISVTLQAGRHYMFGNTSSGSVTQYFNSSSSLSSFADHVGYGTCSGFPSPDILLVIYNAAYTMYHRYTTDESTDYASSGSVVSSVIELPASGNWGWDVMDLNATMPENTELTIDVLNGSDESVILADVNSSTDINRITATELKLRANLSTDDPANTPALHDWSVSYAGPCESNWSNVESSLQCDTLCDFDNNNEINFADFAILAGQWLRVPDSPSADIAPEVPDGFVDYLDLAVFVEKWLFDITCTEQN